ncbi:MAG: hypothetical protein HKO62_10970 [Gammaproteobacteria bacterium]|nr:hypothetical protein [Gammaproteobacteria bacterium]
MMGGLEHLRKLIAQINGDATDAAFWPRIKLSDDAGEEGGTLKGSIVLSLTRGGQEVYQMTEALDGVATIEDVENRLASALSRFLALQTDGKAGRRELDS